MISSNIFDYFANLYDEATAKKYIEYIHNDPIQYLRVNLLKNSKEDLTSLLKNEYNVEVENLPDIPFGLKVTKGEEQVSKLIEHIIGLYYMQGLSSMLPPLVLAPTENDIVLDLCSAPGSKTTEMAEMMNNKGTLVANEISMERVKTLVYNLDRMNIINYGVLHQKGEYMAKYYDNYFDKILVDAPCSGLGIIQKKDEVNNWWNVDKAANLGELQLKLLVTAIKMLKTGGEIVYSTCTLSVEENEAVLNNVLKKYPVELIPINLPVESYDAFTSYQGMQFHSSISNAKRILPWQVNSDGFFIAKLRKLEDTKPLEPFNIKSRGLSFINHDNKKIKDFLSGTAKNFGFDYDILSNYKFMLKTNDVFFVAEDWDEFNIDIFERIGTKFGIIDKRGEITLHTQAAQTLGKHITKNIVAVEDKDDLKRYLEGGIIKAEQPGGQYVLSYRNNILGTGLVNDNKLKSRFPRSKRSQTINLY